MTGLVLTGIYASKNSFLLKTPHAQHGLLSLGLAYDNATAYHILKEWKADTAYEQDYSKQSDTIYNAKPIVGLPTAIAQRKADFGFIFFYLCLFDLLFYRNSGDFQGFPQPRTMLLVLFVAAVSDGLQNLLMLHDMVQVLPGNGQPELAPFIGISFCLKWLCWLFLSYYFYRRVIHPRGEKWLIEFQHILGEVARQLWCFRIVVTGLLVLYLVLTVVDQGEDLLVAIGDTLPGAGFFVLGMLVLAMLNWYLPKIYDNTENLRVQKIAFAKDQWNIKKYLGRLIGSVTLLVPATGLLSAMQTYHVPFWLSPVPPWLIFAVVSWLYTELLRQELLDTIYKKGNQFITRRYWWTVALILIVVAGLGYCIAKPVWPLGCLSMIFFLLSFLFLLTVNYRTLFKNNFPFLPLLYGTAALVFLVFFLFNFRFFSSALTQYNRFYSLPVFVAGLVFYTVLVSGLLLLGHRFHFQVITGLLIVMVVLSSHSITDFHLVSTVPRTNQPNVKESSLRAYMHRWFETRRNEIDSQNKKGRSYPVFFVNAYGGGIRAAAWTVMAIGRLNTQMQHDTTGTTFRGNFEHYVFSYSGASGGTIGESLLAAADIHDPAAPIRDAAYDTTGRLLRVFRHDYLTNDLVGILGRDFWMGSFGQNWYDDRATVNEKAYEDYLCHLGISYAIPFRLGWQNPAMEVPLLVSNTFDVNTSRKGILSPVRLSPSDFPGVVLVDSLVGDHRDIHLSTGAFLSARFPYVSPTGKFNERHHFTDGGTIENAGSETSLQLIRVFNSIKDSLVKKDPAYRCIKICILSLPNEVKAITKVKRLKNTYEATAPIKGLLGTISGNADRDEAINQDSARRYGWNYYQMAPQDARIREGKIHPILPLGWQISDYALEMMEITVAREEHSDLNKVMDFFKTEFKKP